MAERYIQQYNRMMRWFLKLEELYKGAEIPPRLKKMKKVTFIDKNGKSSSSLGTDREESLLYIQSSKDIVYAFFQNCHHLKDWIQNDPVLSNTHPDIKDKIDDFRQRRKCLQVCGNLCNCSKHMRLTIRYPEESPTNIGAGYGYAIEHNGDRFLIKHIGFRIEWDGCEKDSLALAKECIEAWNEFLNQNNIKVPTRFYF